jgi:peroxiredoxin
MTRAAVLAVLLTACGGAASAVAPSGPPTWERPGLGGAVRPEMGSPQPGEPAPDLGLPDLEGHEVTLASMRGSWVVLHFTATWCPFCDSEVAHLGELAQAFAPRGVKTVIVDVEEKPEKWREYAASHVSPAVLALLDASGRTAARFAPPRAQPSFDDRAQAVLDATIILDPSGRIRLFLLPDSAHFDPTFRAVRAELDALVPPPVVGVRVSSPALAAGEEGEIGVTLEIAPGFHVMSDRPSAPTYVPTRVELEGEPDVEIGAARYPAPGAFALGERAIATFEGAVDVRVPITVARGASAGARRLRGTVRYQACTPSRCLFPASRAFEVPLAIRASG